ncbi:MAG: N-acetyltransferase family protein [Oscillibacter sp.]|nr:N-acetyltransferase family protein [Oscillibacter sp.]
MIRLAQQEDAKALLAIYSQYIDTAITFEEKLPSEAEFTQRIQDISAEYPYLVWEEDGKVLGYAYGHRLRERAAYQWDAELSIYLDRSITGKGIGSKLYTVLMELLKLQGICTVYGIVVIPNDPSAALHQRLGFQLTGTFLDTGFKLGKWWGTWWFEKHLLSHDVAPAPLIPFPTVPSNKVAEILQNA